MAKKWNAVITREDGRQFIAFEGSFKTKAKAIEWIQKARSLGHKVDLIDTRTNTVYPVN